MLTIASRRMDDGVVSMMLILPTLGSRLVKDFLGRAEK